jgi:hypothetical protein
LSSGKRPCDRRWQRLRWQWFIEAKAFAQPFRRVGQAGEIVGVHILAKERIGTHLAHQRLKLGKLNDAALYGRLTSDRAKPLGVCLDEAANCSGDG